MATFDSGGRRLGHYLHVEQAAGLAHGEPSRAQLEKAGKPHGPTPWRCPSNSRRLQGSGGDGADTWSHPDLQGEKNRSGNGYALKSCFNK